MKTIVLTIALGFGGLAVANAQSTSTTVERTSKSKAPSTVEVDVNRAGISTSASGEKAETKGVSSHGPNDVNEPRKNFRKLDAKVVRTKQVRAAQTEAVDKQEPKK